ncbi:MAG: homoserine O-acetyltransferase/O-succinyltransferase [Chloroflexota bacterium]|nr:homoserine O-acetyltransferase/O-succinyltransferase [Chloroflexota bacterium]
MRSSNAPGSAGTVRTQVLDLPGRLPLDSGRELAEVRIAYETYGTLAPAKDNTILVCHALSGDAHAAGWSDDPNAPTTVDGVGAAERGKSGLGWWDGMIGPGKAFDTDRYFVVCTNLIGSCRGSTGPGSIDPATRKPYGGTFPVLTVGDMVRAQRAFLHELGIETLLAASGGSLGGMQALEWAVAYPDAVRAIVPIASTARLGTQGVAWNAIARNAITSDPDWQGGAYYGTGRSPDAGIKVARMVGHITYLSAQAVREKFGRRFQRGGDEPLYDLAAPDFEVESYLRYQADAFAARFDANAYLYISRALTYFDLARSYGAGSLERAVAAVRAATLLLSFSSDWLYPPRDSEEVAAALRAQGKDVRHAIIEADYGHDSFLLEEAEMTREISAFLNQVDQADRVGERVRP